LLLRKLKALREIATTRGGGVKNIREGSVKKKT